MSEVHHVDSTTVVGAKTEFRELLNTGEGVCCPVCERIGRTWKVKLHATIAKALITHYRLVPQNEYAHVPSLPGDTHAFSAARLFGLIEEERIARPDGGRAGWWRLTETGREFVEGTARIAEHAVVYDNALIDYSGREDWSIYDSLGDKFHYGNLMEGK